MTLKGLKERYYWFLINNLYSGTKRFEEKNRILRKLGYNIGNGTKVVGPLFITSRLEIGDNCWIGANFHCYGNGLVKIGNNCDIAPEVTFLTGGHNVGTKKRRAGDGLIFIISVGEGTWIGGRSTLFGNINIGDSSVIGACSNVFINVPKNSLVVGNPGKVVKKYK